MGAAISACVRIDATKMEEIVGNLYRKADPDRDGYIPGPQAPVIAAKALKKAHIETISQAQIDEAFSKVSGPDHRVTESQINSLINALLAQAKPSDSVAVRAAGETI